MGIILTIVVFATFSIIKSLNKESLPVESLKKMSKNVDIEIENFKVTHEVLGEKDWEIEAKEAQVKNDEQKILLTEVNVTLNTDENQKSTISADTGTINSETKDIELEGNVKFKADMDNMFDQFQKKSKPENKLETQ